MTTASGPDTREGRAGDTERLVALLPMKAHSERVPGKNFRAFVDRPLFRWMLDTLLAMPEVDLVVINTDARGLLAQHGVADGGRIVIRDRREDLQGDFTSMNAIIADDVRHVQGHVYLMTHATNPLLRRETIRAALAEFANCRAGDAADSLFSVTRFQSRFYSEAGHPINHDPADLVRTQDLPVWLEENSNMYLFSRESFERAGARIGLRPRLFVTPRTESVDVDDEESWQLAETLARARLLMEARS